MKEQPEKTSNIWHLVCLRPWDEVLKADDNQISEDYSMLERRMEHFLGLHYTENTIENGIKRLSIIKTPFNKTNIDRINRQMLKMSGQRDTLKKRWDECCFLGCDSHNDPVSNFIPDRGNWGRCRGGSVPKWTFSRNLLFLHCCRTDWNHDTFSENFHAVESVKKIKGIWKWNP